MRIPLITRKLTAIIYDFLADPSTKGENNDQNFFYDTLAQLQDCSCCLLFASLADMEFQDN